MKKQIIIIAVLSAILIFLIKLFEIKYLTGDLPVKIYITVIGVIFLGIGIWFGLKIRVKGVTRENTEEKLEIKSHSDGILTERETKLVTLLAKGLSNKEIAEKIFVSENTVKKHLNNVYSKLEVKSRTQAISKAKQLGILK